MLCSASDARRVLAAASDAGFASCPTGPIRKRGSPDTGQAHAARLGLAGRFVIGYSGNLGRAHEFEPWCRAAAGASRIRLSHHRRGAKAEACRDSVRARASKFLFPGLSTGRAAERQPGGGGCPFRQPVAGIGRTDRAEQDLRHSGGRTAGAVCRRHSGDVARLLTRKIAESRSK